MGIIKKQNKLEYIIFALAITLLSGVSFFDISIGSADNSISQIDQSTVPTSGDTQDQIYQLQKKAAIYRQIIDIKKQQTGSLNSQLSLTTSNIQQIQSQIDDSSQQIDDYNTQIIRLTSQISEKQTIIDTQKKLLASLMQSYYETMQKDPVDAYLNDGNFTSLLVTKDQLAQTGEKIRSLVQSVTDLQSSLEAQSADLDQKKTAIVTVQQKLQDQESSMDLYL